MVVISSNLIYDDLHTFPHLQKTISFTLDKTKPNLVMRQADGFWHVQAPADRYEQLNLTK